MKQLDLFKEKYVLWIGGIDDHFDNYDDAEFAYLERLAQGYDDAILETVIVSEGIL